ncbi:hypothetical protein F5Y16DRAFT_401663 [Xylariaceae sp. FL0255]|nr:hypothetical protein F5Y16DRAFT_401663 [Xylariaceae sp. FL0255]
MQDPATQKKSGAPTLRGLLTLYPVQERIFSELDIKSILALCSTSWDMRLDIKSYLWDINKRLNRFFKDPLAFRTELGRSEAVISGSFALQFFARTFWPNSDLDISVRNDEDKVISLVKFLVEKEGYELASNDEIVLEGYTDSNGVFKPFSNYRLEEISRIITFHKYDKKDTITTITGTTVTTTPTTPKAATPNTKKSVKDKDKVRDKSPKPAKPTRTPLAQVQIIVTKEHPIKAIINGYYTSCIVNFITWNRAYCLFPRATLLFKETIPLTRWGDDLMALHTKYCLRGWRLRVILTHNQKASLFPASHPRGRIHPLGHFMREERFIGGSDTWKMRLDTAGVDRREIKQPDMIIDYSAFRFINFDPQQTSPDGEGLRLETHTFRSNSLRYTYLYGDYKTYWVRLSHRLERNTLAQMSAKLKGSEAGALVEGIQTATQLHDLEFEKPAGWDYWDDALPEAFEAMWEEGREGRVERDKGKGEEVVWALPG